MRYNGLVIGAGSAGVFRKEGNHANAYLEHPLCQLAGVYDVSLKNATKAAELLSCKWFDSLNTALNSKPHIVSIAVGPENQVKIITEVCEKSTVAALFVEKPMAYDADTALNIIKHCHNRGKRIYVNYQRRADDNFIRLRDDLKKKKRGRLQSGIIYYTRGMWTNASHWIDLSIMLFGMPEWVMAQKNPIPSPYENDPNVTIILGYIDFHILIVPLLSWKRGFFTGDLDLIFEKERLYIPNSLHYQAKHVMRWKSNNQLLEVVPPDFSLTSSDNDFLGMLNMIVSDIEAGRQESINPEESVWSIRIMELAKKSYIENKRFDLNLDNL